ncbi:MAG: hypothetical protein ACOCRK_04585 [bacterium]
MKKIIEILNRLEEKFITSLSQDMGGYSEDIYIEVFKNPSRKEFNEVASDTTGVADSVRFIATDRENLYIWKIAGLHEYVLPELHINYNKAQNNPDFLLGTTVKRGNQHVFDLSKSFYKGHIKEIIQSRIRDGYFDWMRDYNIDFDIR